MSSVDALLDGRRRFSFGGGVLMGRGGSGSRDRIRRVMRNFNDVLLRRVRILWMIELRFGEMGTTDGAGVIDPSGSFSESDMGLGLMKIGGWEAGGVVVLG